jgi:hypothetical protein
MNPEKTNNPSPETAAVIAEFLTCNDWIDALAKRWEREAADETFSNPPYEEALENCAFDLRSAARQASGYAPPRWIAEKPAAAGWWWCEMMSLGKPLRMIVQVSHRANGIGLGIYCGWTDTWSMINEISARWAGPLPEPDDAPDEERRVFPERKDEPLRAGSGAWLARKMTNMNKTQIEGPRCSQLDSIARLAAGGWREYPNQFKSARCFYKYFDTTTRCACNDDKPGMQIEIAVSEWEGVENYEIELTGEMRDGTWLKIHQWVLPHDIKDVVALIPRLLGIWEAANSKHSDTAP